MKALNPPYFITLSGDAGKKYLRDFVETFYGKMTDSEYALFTHKVRWQSVFQSMRRIIPNDFKSKN